MSKAFQFNGTSYVSSLPFINIQADNWFDIYPTGDETKDLNIGASCGLLLIKAIADDVKPDFTPENSPSILPRVIESLMKQDGELFKDIVRGFFWVIDMFMQAYCLKIKDEITKHSYDDLILEISPVILR